MPNKPNFFFYFSLCDRIFSSLIDNEKNLKKQKHPYCCEIQIRYVLKVIFVDILYCKVVVQLCFIERNVCKTLNCKEVLCVTDLDIKNENDTKRCEKMLAKSHHNEYNGTLQYDDTFTDAVDIWGDINK